MNHCEQAWHAFKAEMVIHRPLTWADAITSHTERDWHESREQARLARSQPRAKRHGGTHYRTLQKRNP